MKSLACIMHSVPLCGKALRAGFFIEHACTLLSRQVNLWRDIRNEANLLLRAACHMQLRFRPIHWPS